MNALFKDHYEDLFEIINCIKVGIYITDGKGNTILLNDESCKTGSLTREEVMGKNMKELEEMGFVQESVTLKALETGEETVLVQKLGDGGEVFVTGKPFYRKNKIEYVVCTERDITEMSMLRELLKEKEEREKKYVREVEYLKNRNISMSGDIITEDFAMKRIVEKALRAAKHDATILLTGESGTGKEVFANFIYKNSSRIGKPFIKINCAAIPENLLESEFFGYEKGAFTGADKEGKIGIFELANGGTLFLDEIADLPIHMQSKLLRALQEHEIMRVGGQKPIPLDIRIIAATNVNLKKAIEKGNFREDLYYRLNIMPIDIIPLRERKADIEKLTNHFIEIYSKEYKVKKMMTKDAIAALKKHDWPGNIRELKNVIERLIISFDGVEITKFQVNSLLYPNQEEEADLHIDEGQSLQNLMDNYEKQILAHMLQKYSRAAEITRVLGVNKSTLSRRLDKYNLK